MKSPIAIRYFSLSPEGELLRLSQVFVLNLHQHPGRVRAPSFGNKTMRLAECLVRRSEEGKPASIQQMGFSLIRFDQAGKPDMKRFWKDVYASLPDLLAPDHEQVPMEGNVLRMDKVFQGNGSRWKPSLDEIVLLEKAALGVIRPPELDREWRIGKAGVSEIKR
jgi:hypothetical protein